MQIDSQPVPRRSRVRRHGARLFQRQAHYRTTRWREQSPKASIHMDHEALKQKVFGQLFQQNYAWLCARLSYRTGCAHSAQDIASETFLRVWSHTDPSAIREPRALLTTIAQRLMYEGWRRRELEKPTCRCWPRPRRKPIPRRRNSGSWWKASSPSIACSMACRARPSRYSSTARSTA